MFGVCLVRLIVIFITYICRRNNILYEMLGELRTTNALAILGGHRMALGCSGLHANGCFNAG